MIVPLRTSWLVSLHSTSTYYDRSILKALGCELSLMREAGTCPLFNPRLLWRPMMSREDVMTSYDVTGWRHDVIWRHSTYTLVFLYTVQTPDFLFSSKISFIYYSCIINEEIIKSEHGTSIEIWKNMFKKQTTWSMLHMHNDYAVYLGHWGIMILLIWVMSTQHHVQFIMYLPRFWDTLCVI